VVVEAIHSINLRIKAKVYHGEVLLKTLDISLKKIKNSVIINCLYSGSGSHTLHFQHSINIDENVIFYFIKDYFLY